jgi:hypothetical protein
MILNELISRLSDIADDTGDVEVKMECGGFSAPITNVEYQGSDEEGITIFIK